MEWNQKPHRYTVNFPEPLVPLIEARKETVPYDGVSSYLFWMTIYDLTLQKPHRFTPWLMRQPKKRQFEYFECLIQGQEDKDLRRPGSWMETRIREEAISLISSGALDDLVIQRARMLKALQE